MTKFKVGDRVLGNENAYEHRVGKLGTVRSIDGNDNIWVAWDGDNTQYAPSSCINHHGQRIAELGVKPGDVVECVNHDYILTDTYIIGKNYTVDSDHRVTSEYGGTTGLLADFRIISRAANEWTLCPDGYTEQDNHECTYYMGEPTHYRVVDVPLVDVERRVAFDGNGLDFNNYKIFHNATLRGQTKNGKPVGQWVIDMDEVE